MLAAIDVARVRSLRWNSPGGYGVRCWCVLRSECMTEASSLTGLDPVRITNVHSVPLRGSSLEGVWTVFQRDLSGFGLQETTHQTRDLHVPFPVEAVYTHASGSRWLVVRNQDERAVLLHESLPSIRYAKGDPIFWGRIAGEIEDDEAPPLRERESWVRVRLFMGKDLTNVTSLPTREITLRNFYSRLDNEVN